MTARDPAATARDALGAAAAFAAESRESFEEIGDLVEKITDASVAIDALVQQVQQAQDDLALANAAVGVVRRRAERLEEALQRIMADSPNIEDACHIAHDALAGGGETMLNNTTQV